MIPSEQLRAEHEAILAMLGVLDRISRRLEQGATIPPQHLSRLLEFFQVFADTCHHAKEEEFLFPAFEAAGIPREGGPIGVMLDEHQNCRQAIARMRQSLEGVNARQSDAIVAFIVAAREYTNLLSAHIQKENHILFPMGDQMLQRDRYETLMREFDRLEENRIGAGKHEEFHRLIESLETAFPPENGCGDCASCCCG